MSDGTFVVREMLIENASNRNCQRTDIVLDHFPSQLEVHAEILVDHDIASTGDIPPGCARVLLQEFCGQSLYGFADDLETPNYGVLLFHIASEVRIGRPAV